MAHISPVHLQLLDMKVAYLKSSSVESYVRQVDLKLYKLVQGNQVAASADGLHLILYVLFLHATLHLSHFGPSLITFSLLVPMVFVHGVVGWYSCSQ